MQITFTAHGIKCTAKALAFAITCDVPTGAPDEPGVVNLPARVE